LRKLPGLPLKETSMAAHKLVRFTKFEIQLREAAEKTLADATSSIGEKRHARRVLHDTLHEAQGRLLRKRAKDALGPRPAGGPELEAWRSGLKRIKAELVLDDPSSSLAQVRLAERTLKEIEQRERLRGIAPAVHAPRNAKLDSSDAKPASPAPVADTSRSSEEQAAIDRFFAEGEPPTQEEPRIVPNGPPNAQLFCDVHQTPLSTCGCANNEICPQCLIPRKNCGHR
jgi:hypothetical protein